MSNRRSRRSVALRTAARIATVAVVAVLAVIYRHEVVQALRAALQAGWPALLVLPLFWLWNHAAALGWRSILTATAEQRPPSHWRLAIVRLEAQAMNLIVPLSSLPGDLLRSTLTAHGSGGLWRSATAVALDTLASSAAGLLFTIGGVLLHRSLVPASGGAVVLVGALTVVLLALLVSAPALMAQLGRRYRTQRSALARGLRELARQPARMRRALASSIGWHVIERVLTAAEIALIAFSLGLQLGVTEALFAGAVMTGFTLIFFFVPVQLGAAEGGLSLAFSALGDPPELGLSVALVRRARQLVVLAVGAVLVLLLERGRTPMHGSQADDQAHGDGAVGEADHARPVSPAG